MNIEHSIVFFSKSVIKLPLGLLILFLDFSKARFDPTRPGPARDRVTGLAHGPARAFGPLFGPKSKANKTNRPLLHGCTSNTSSPVTIRIVIIAGLGKIFSKIFRRK